MDEIFGYVIFRMMPCNASLNDFVTKPELAQLGKFHS